jgi:Spy/CpxP family protein refolding chaperone
MKNTFSKTSITFVGIVLLGLTLLSVKSIAGEQYYSSPFKHAMSQKHHGMDANKMLFMLDKKLDLTDEQRTKIGEVIDLYNPQLRDLKFKMKDGKENGKKLVMSDVFDETVSQQYAKDQSEILSQMIILKLRMKHEAHSLLSIEQKKKLAEMFEDKHSRPF